MNSWFIGVIGFLALTIVLFGQDSQAVWRKANGIVIDVKLENVSLAAAVDAIRKLSRVADTRETDEKWKGVRIGFDRMRANEVEKRVTLDLKSVTVADALDAVGDATGRRVDYFGDGVVLRRVLPGELDQDRVVTRWFRIDQGTFPDLIGDDSDVADPFGLTPKKVKRRSIQEMFERIGVNFGEDTWVKYLSTTGLLVVRNKVRDLELIEAYLEPIGGYWPTELSVRCDVFSLPVKVAMEVLSKEQDDSRLLLEIRKAVKDDKAKWEGSPIIRTRSGQRAKMESGRRIKTVSHYQTVDGTESPVFEETFVGTSIELEPVVGSDGLTIELNLAFQFSSGEPKIRKRAIVTASGMKVDLEDLDVEEQILSTALTLHEGRTVLAGTFRSGSGETIVVFVNVSRRSAEAEPVLPE